MTAGLATQVLAIIRAECDWFGRFPPVPLDLTADSSLEPWFCPVDSVCVQMSLDETFGFEIPSSEAKAWTTVADIIDSVKRLLPAGVAA